MKSRPDIALRFELVTNRLKYLGDTIIEIEKERDILCAELLFLNNLKELYDEHPDDIIDREREAVDYLDAFPVKKTEPAKRTRRGNSDTAPRIKEAIEKYGPLTLGELIAELKDVSRGTVSSSLTLMKRNGEILAPQKFGGPWRLP